MSKVKLPVDIVDTIVEYISILESRVPAENKWNRTKEESEAIAYMLIKLADAREEE